MALDLSGMNLEERTKYLKLKAQYGKKLLPWYKRWWGITILVILGLILILGTAAGFYIWNQVQTYKADDVYNQQTNSDKALQLAIYGSGTDYSLGTDNATLTIVEFSDFACPYCQQAHTILKKIVARYPGKVKIIFRDLPLHENSVDLAMGARCAGEQGKFWEMHDQLFANQDNLKGTGDDLKTVIYSLAGTLGLNAATYDNCYTNKKYLSEISQGFTDAQTLKLKGTPSWFLNGKLLTGYIPENDFLTLLDNYFASLK
jgi:protein-disulfide isomerase